MAAPTGFTTTVEVVAPPDHAVRGFARWVAESVGPSADVLNIGAGCNLSGDLLPVRRRAGRLVGVDPDASIRSNAHVDEWHQATLEEFAATHVEEFDVALAVFVLEHVSDPEAFTAACFRTLRPGGVLFALTVHKFQYFGLATWATTRLHVNERLLRRLKGEEVVRRYHFPTEYRMNSTHQCAGHLDRAGFRSAEFRMFDKPELYCVVPAGAAETAGPGLVARWPTGSTHHC